MKTTPRSWEVGRVVAVPGLDRGPDDDRAQVAVGRDTEDGELVVLVRLHSDVVAFTPDNAAALAKSVTEAALYIAIGAKRRPAFAAAVRRDDIEAIRSIVTDAESEVVTEVGPDAQDRAHDLARDHARRVADDIARRRTS